MTQQDVPPRALRTQRARPLSGRFAVPGDPAVALRALLVGAMALGESRLANLPETEPVAAMACAVQALGARLEARDGEQFLSGLGSAGLLAPGSPLDLGDAEDAAALLLGAVGIYPFGTAITGDAGGLGAVFAALRELGVTVVAEAEGRLPVTLKGPRTAVPGPFAAGEEAVKSALLLAALAIPGTTTVTEALPSLDHTERMLAAFGAEIAIWDSPGGGRSYALRGLPDLRAQEIAVPGDPAVAAFALVAGLVVTGSDMVVGNVLMNPRRAALLPTLVEMGAELGVLAEGKAGGEEVADIGVRHSALRGTMVPAERTAALTDVLPILVVAASFATGDTIIEGIETPAGTHGWLAALQHGLSANGVLWEGDARRLTVHGRGRITGGGTVPAHEDPRIALSFLVMGMATRDPVTVLDAAPVGARFPGMLAALTELGAVFKRES